MNKSKDQPLNIEIKDDQLVLRIGIDTLAFCSSKKNGGPLLHWDIDPNKHKEWAKDIIHELEAEDEVGNSAITELLDEMMEKAVDNGSCATLPSKFCPKKLRGAR